ncbi:hypothetical protein BC937DRAFT_89796 [Endogone sp. FLAS-F59071]|nr:hypothetical protein BC937DRAFT_89796 [Endogone sp. FLAS-F59071]|eukprot:RUS22284.1 hypothetical protein BC937DRAFT_89796 [Endogone sp. FLAS-F59071]
MPAEHRDLLESRLDVIAGGPFKGYNLDADDKVQVLIHPSMYPYIEGISYIPDQSALPSPSPSPSPRVRWRMTSKYQWLPAQFYVYKNGSASIKSYINNLDLSNQDLYIAIELTERSYYFLDTITIVIIYIDKVDSTYNEPSVEFAHRAP